MMLNGWRSEKKMQNKNRDRKFKIELKSLDKITGDFAGYAAVFGEQDLLDDICLSGCFADTLAAWKQRGTLPRVLWCHGWVIGHITEIAEDNHGLKVAGKIWIDDPDVANQWQVALAASDQLSMSFGYIAREFERLDDGVRKLKKVDLLDDITLTLDPVNPAAKVSEAKSKTVAMLPDKRTLEAVLRDAGLSRKESKSLLANGYDALRDAKPLDADACASLGAIVTEILNK